MKQKERKEPKQNREAKRNVLEAFEGVNQFGAVEKGTVEWK